MTPPIRPSNKRYLDKYNLPKNPTQHKCCKHTIENKFPEINETNVDEIYKKCLEVKNKKETEPDFTENFIVKLEEIKIKNNNIFRKLEDIASKKISLMFKETFDIEINKDRIISNYVGNEYVGFRDLKNSPISKFNRYFDILEERRHGTEYNILSYIDLNDHIIVFRSEVYDRPENEGPIKYIKDDQIMLYMHIINKKMTRMFGFPHYCIPLNREEKFKDPKRLNYLIKLLKEDNQSTKSIDIKSKKFLSDKCLIRFVYPFVFILAIIHTLILLFCPVVLAIEFITIFVCGFIYFPFPSDISFDDCM